MKFTLALNNFTSGAWSPKMYSRTDAEAYLKACTQLKNFLAQVHGGAQYRGGLELFQIAANALQSSYDTGITNTATDEFKMIPYLPFDKSKATILCISQVAGQFHVLPAGTAPLLPIVFFGAWTPSAISYVQVGDYIVFADGTGVNDPHVFFYNPFIADYEVSPLAKLLSGNDQNKYWKSQPWDKLVALNNNNTMTVTGAVGTVLGAVTITATSPIAFTNETGYFMRFCNSNKKAGVVLVTGYTSATVVTGVVYQILPEAAGFVYASEINTASFWQIAMWSNNKGFPRTVCAFQGRIIFGGSRTFPDTLWGSRISDYANFEEIPEPNTTGIYGFASSAFTADNSRSFALTPNSPEASNIVALSAGKSLAVHTEASEIVCYGSNGALGPNNATFDSSTSFGAKAVQPKRVNNFSNFVQATGKRIRDIIFSFNEDQFKSTDLNFVSDHLLLSDEGGYADVVELTTFEGRSSYLYALTSTGKVNVCTLDRDYQVNAWAEMVIAGHLETLPYVYTTCTFKEHVYMLVKRFVNGVAHVSLERMGEPWEFKNSANIPALLTALGRPICMDSYKVATGTNPDGDAKSTIWNTDGTNVNWFRGLTVSVVADGDYIGEKVVDNSGNITTDKRYKHLAVGFIYEGIIESLPIEQGSQYGASNGRIKRIDEAVVKIINANGIEVGDLETDMEELQIRQPDQPMNEATHYFTGDKVITFPASYDRAVKVAVRQRKPYPAYIVSIALRGQTYEG